MDAFRWMVGGIFVVASFAAAGVDDSEWHIRAEQALARFQKAMLSSGDVFSPMARTTKKKTWDNFQQVCRHNGRPFLAPAGKHYIVLEERECRLAKAALDTSTAFLNLKRHTSMTETCLRSASLASGIFRQVSVAIRSASFSHYIRHNKSFVIRDTRHRDNIYTMLVVMRYAVRALEGSQEFVKGDTDWSEIIAFNLSAYSEAEAALQRAYDLDKSINLFTSYSKTRSRERRIYERYRIGERALLRAPGITGQVFRFLQATSLEIGKRVLACTER